MQRASRPESVRIEAGREANDGQPGNTYAEKRPTGSRTGAVPSQVRSHSPHCDFRRGASRCPDFPAARQKPARSGQRLPPRSKKKLTEMGEWELGLSLPPHSGASRWSAMRSQVEVQPQVNYPLTQTGLLIEVHTALSYMLTIGDPERFQKSRMVGGFLGMRPRKQD